MAPIQRRGRKPAKPARTRFVLQAPKPAAPKTRFTVTTVSAEAGLGHEWHDARSLDEAARYLAIRAKNRQPPPEGLRLPALIAGFIYDPGTQRTTQYRFTETGEPVLVITHNAEPFRNPYAKGK